MTDLLPCPFCGSNNLRYEFCGSQGYIECNECGTQGPCDERAADPICDLDAACDAWNRRAALAQPEPQGPTDEELMAAYWEAFKNAAPCGADQSWLAGLRAVALWDRSVIEPDGPAVLGSCEHEALLAARRPKPPSLKEQALEALDRMWNGGSTHADWQLFRRALEALPE